MDLPPPFHTQTADWDAVPTVTFTIAGQTAPAAGTTTTLPGTEITIVGGPNATAPIPGSQSDPADFYGIVLVVVAIAVAIVVTRLIFRRRGPEHEQAR